jgi:hypothetical protein
MICYFCNGDMWFDPDCLQRLAGRTDLADRVAAADPWQWTYDGTVLIHAGTKLRRTRPGEVYFLDPAFQARYNGPISPR